MRQRFDEVHGSAGEPEAARRVHRIGSQAGFAALGWGLMGVGVFMATMPFLGPLVGVPFDGSQAWVVDRNRVLLHVLPGVAGVAVGYLFITAARRRAHRDLTATGLAIAALGVGIWSGLGPWLLDALLPASEPTARMFEGIPGFQGLPIGRQLLLEAVCHWLPGMAFLSAGALTYVSLLSARHADGRLPPARLSIGRKGR